MTEEDKKEAHLVALQAYDYQSAYSGYVARANAERERLKDTRLYSQEVIDSYEEQLKQLETQSHDQVKIIEHLEQQLKQERNKAIDDGISSIIVNHHGISPSMLETLESLKK